MLNVKIKIRRPVPYITITFRTVGVLSCPSKKICDIFKNIIREILIYLPIFIIYLFRFFMYIHAMKINFSLSNLEITIN